MDTAPTKCDAWGAYGKRSRVRAAAPGDHAARSPRQARDILGKEKGPGASVRQVEGRAAGTGSQPGVLVT